MNVVLVALIACAVIGLNVRATLLIAQDTLSERRRKGLQVALVWVLPIIGAIVVLAVHRPAEPPSRQYRQSLDPGDDYGMSGRAQKKLSDAIDSD